MKIITLCSVLGCPSSNNTPNILFYNLPPESINGVPNSLLALRRNQWLEALGQIEPSTDDNQMKNICICSRHFMSGQPAAPFDVQNIDWIPRFNIHYNNRNNKYFLSINNQLYQIKTDNQQELNNNLSSKIDRIITNLPEIAEEFDVPDYVMIDKLTFNEDTVKSNNYINDHDYVRLPLNPLREQNNPRDHDYSTREQPACYYSNLKYFCNICKTLYLNSFDFNRDQMNHMRNNEVTCEICCEAFLTSSCLNSHLLLHTVVCDVCGCVVPRVQLKEHQKVNTIQKEVFKQQNGYTVRNEEKVEFCVVCMKLFRERKDFVEHVLRVHQGVSNMIKKVRNREMGVYLT